MGRRKQKASGASRAADVTRHASPIRNMLLVGASIIGLSACADIPPQFRVDTGAQPQYEDKTVRFRTTYYFRVFDLCEGRNADGSIVQKNIAEDFQWDQPVFYRNDRGEPLRLEKDSLYRFTMTGKALAITNKIHFESGTLKASQIEPFGSDVEFDPDSGRFFYQSQEATQLEAAQNLSYRSIDRLKGLLKDEMLTDFEPDIHAAIQREIANITRRSSEGQVAVASASSASGSTPTESPTRVQEAVNHALSAFNTLTGAEQAALNLTSPAPRWPTGIGFSNPTNINWSNATNRTVETTLTNLIAEFRASAGETDQAVRQASNFVRDIFPKVLAAVDATVDQARQDHEAAKQALEKAETELEELEARNDNFVKAKEENEPKILPAKQTVADRIATLTTAASNLRTAQSTKVGADAAVDQAQQALAAANEASRKAVEARDALVNADDAATQAANTAVTNARTAADAALTNLRAESTKQVDAGTALGNANTAYTEALTTCRSADKTLDDLYEAMAKSAVENKINWSDPNPQIRRCDGTDRPASSYSASGSGFVDLNNLILGIAAKKAEIETDADATAAGEDGGLKQIVEDSETALTEAAARRTDVEMASGEAEDKLKASPTTASSGGACEPGFERRRGFQVMGPEGVRTFNQDERLIMAMSSSADPLIETLQEVSSRVLQRRSVEKESLLPFAQERINIRDAQLELRTLDDTSKPASDAAGAIAKVLTAFDKEAAQ